MNPLLSCSLRFPCGVCPFEINGDAATPPPARAKETLGGEGTNVNAYYRRRKHPRLDKPPRPHGAGFFKGNPFAEPDTDINGGDGGGGSGCDGGDGGGDGDGGDRFAESWNSTPHVPPPHKGQSQPCPQQPRADEEEPGAADSPKDGSVVARA